MDTRRSSKRHKEGMSHGGCVFSPYAELVETELEIELDKLAKQVFLLHSACLSDPIVEKMSSDVELRM